MREILFRGRAINAGKWLVGDLFQYAATAQIWTTDPIDGGKWNYLVNPSTVGQYTGLQDMNGKRIFEGDVVHVHDTLVRCDKPYHEFEGYVEYRDGSFVICCEDSTHYRWLDYEVKVIGNIHDNPELLKGEQED